MVNETKPPRWPLNRQSVPRPSEHRLEFLDQTALELMRATGRSQLMQCIWVYEHPVNREGIERFHRNLHASLGSRLIERSPLPFGRPRWVRPSEPPPLRVFDRPRPREELLDWADSLAALPIDPEQGPGWHLSTQRFADGSTGVCIVCSHVIFDGVGGLMAVADAINGHTRDAGYDKPQSRTGGQAILADLRQAARDMPLTIHTAVKAVWLAQQKWRQFAKSRPAASARRDRTPVTVPSVAVHIDAGEWDAKAESLAGNTYSLLAGFAAKLAEHLGRCRLSDGAVTLVIAINLRDSLSDDRALAMAFANATVDPSRVTSDLTESRTAVRTARDRAKNERDPVMELLPLIPWLPLNAVKEVADLLFAYSEDLPVSCSNLGDLPANLACVDGSQAEYFLIRALDVNLTLGELERSHGQLVIVSCRINGKVSISVEAYQLRAENSKKRLREVVAMTLDEFGLAGTIE